MLSPALLPKAADVAPGAIFDALAALGTGDKVPRDAALGVFRRHLARIQNHVQHAFEQDQINGLAAARMLGKLVDGLIRALHDHTVEQLGEPQIPRASPPPAATAAARWRRSATSTCCSSPPRHPARTRCGSSSTCCISCGTSG